MSSRPTKVSESCVVSSSASSPSLLEPAEKNSATQPECHPPKTIKVIWRYNGTYAVYRATGELLVRSTRTPMCAAARALKRMGEDPRTRIEAFREGSSVVALKSTVGYAAGKTILETNKVGPYFRDYTNIDDKT